MYTLTIKNEAPTETTFVLYQKPPTDRSDYFSLAWKTLTIQPMASANLSWSDDYWLFGANTGVLASGVRFVAASAIQADPTAGNEFDLTAELQLTDLRFGEIGKVTVFEDAGIQQNTGSVAIGLAKSPMFATQAVPYKTEAFSEVGQTYYVAFGNFDEGEVLNIDTLGNQSVQIDFSELTSHTVTYNLGGGLVEF